MNTTNRSYTEHCHRAPIIGADQPKTTKFKTLEMLDQPKQKASKKQSNRSFGKRVGQFLRQSRGTQPKEEVTVKLMNSGSKRHFFRKKSNKHSFPIQEICVPLIDFCDQHPQKLIEEAWKDRGYSLETCEALNTGNQNYPSFDFQIANHSLYMTNLVQEGDVEKLSEHFKAGVCPNTCTEFGESLLHIACREGREEIVRLLFEFGARAQICGEYGRTPLHEACCSLNPNLNVVDMLLDQDVDMLRVKDNYGNLPLSYVMESYWPNFQAYFESKLDALWPAHNDSHEHMARLSDPSLLKDQAPNTTLLPVPYQEKVALDATTFLAQDQTNVC